jgi:hypothetical protein
MSKIQQIASAIGLAMLVAGALVGIDTWGHREFFHTEAAAQLQQQVNQQGVAFQQELDSRRREKLQERNWALEAKYNTRDPLKMPADVRIEYQKNQLDMMKIDDKWKGK